MMKLVQLTSIIIIAILLLDEENKKLSPLRDKKMESAASFKS